MTEQKEVRIPIEDLNMVVIECGCGAEVSIDFTKKDAYGADWDHTAGFKCPVCSGQFDSNVRLGFASFLDWRDRVSKSNQKVFFRLRNTSN